MRVAPAMRLMRVATATCGAAPIAARGKKGGEEREGRTIMKRGALHRGEEREGRTIVNRNDTSSVRAARGDFVVKVGRLPTTRAPFSLPGVFRQPETFTDTFTDTSL